jgi:hypothetical protein
MLLQSTTMFELPIPSDTTPDVAVVIHDITNNLNLLFQIQIQMALYFMIRHFAKQVRELNSQVQARERKRESIERLLEYLIKAIAQAVDFDNSVISQYLKIWTQHIKFLMTIAAFKKHPKPSYQEVTIGRITQ